jgi:hypothetical protein
VPDPSSPPSAFVLSPQVESTLRAKAREGNIELARVLDVGLKSLSTRSGTDIAADAEKDPEPGVQLTEAAPRDPVWAGIAQPFGWAVFTLFGLVLVLPFVVIASVPGLAAAERVAQLVNWGTHVLAVVVGLVGSVVAYFFGQRAAERAGS